MNTKTLPDPILVGRENELGELKRFLDSAFEGKGKTIFVSGEAGSGKTRLADEFLKIAMEKDVTILTGRCLSKAAIPYFPFLEAFESYIASSDDKTQDVTSKQLTVKSLLEGPIQPVGNEKTEVATPQTWRDHTFSAIAKEMGFLSVHKPVVLFIDDVHWADSASLSLLHFISRHAVSERIIILASFRSEELSPSAEGLPHPLLETLRQMRREDLFEEIRLSGLNQSQVVEIAQNMLGGNLQKEFAEKLGAESLGNPLFIVESLRMLYEQENLVQEQGQWRLNVDSLGIPSKVKEIILRRIGALKSDQRRVLDAASVIGDKFDPELLGAMLNQDSLSVLETLNAISQSNSLVCSEENFFRFDHPKSREVLYEEIRSPLRKGYHARIAEKMENFQNAKTLQLSDLAYHYTLAENKEKSIQYSLAAGKDALARFSNAEAIKHFRYVLDTVSDVPEYADERVMALEGLGDAFYANCMFKEAINLFEHMAASEKGSLRVRAFRKAMDATFFHGNFSHLLELTKKAEEYAALDRLEGARVRMNVGRALVNLGKPEEALANMEEALYVFKEESSLPDVARDLMGIAVVSVLAGQLEKGLAAAIRSAALYEELGDFRGEMDANSRAGQTLYLCGFAKEALDRAEKAVEIGDKIHDYNRMAEASAYSSWILEDNGDFEGALSRSLEAAGYAKGTDSDLTWATVYSNLGRQYAKLADLKHAEEYFKKLEILPQAVLLSLGVRFMLSKAILLAAKDQYKEANDYFEEALSQYGIRAGPFGLRINYAWALARQGRVDEATAQIEEDKKVKETLKTRFENVAIQLDPMAPREVRTSEEFGIRFDIVNISKEPFLLVRTEGLVPPEFKAIVPPENCDLQNGYINMKERKIGALQIETLKLTLQATNTGVFKLRPRMIYFDNSGKIRSCQPEPITVTVIPAFPSVENVSGSGEKPSEVEFKCAAAQRAFDFLINSFVEDYVRLRLPQERSGWRTLMDIVRQGKVTQFSLYGFSGRRGKAMSELESSGLVDTRLFMGERGRGGRILKVRVAYEKEAVKRQISQKKDRQE